MVDFSQSYQPNGFEIAGGYGLLDYFLQAQAQALAARNQEMQRYGGMGNVPVPLDPNLNYNQELAAARAAAGANATPAQIAQVFANRTGLPPQVALSAVQQATSYQQTTGQALDDAQFGRLMTNAAQTSIPTMDYTQLMAQLSGQVNGEPTFAARQWQDQFGLASEAQQALISGQQPGKGLDVQGITDRLYARARALRDAGGSADLTPDQWVSFAVAEGVPAAQAQKWANQAYAFRAATGRAPTPQETATMGQQVAASMPTEDTRRWEIEQTGFLDGQATMSREKQTADLANQRVAMYGYDPEAMSAGGGDMAWPQRPLDTGAGYTRRQFGTTPTPGQTGMGQRTPPLGQPPEIGPVTRPQFGTTPIPGQTGVGQPTPGTGRINDTPAWGTTGGLSQGMSRTLAPQGGPVRVDRPSQGGGLTGYASTQGGPTQVSPDLSWQNAAMGQQAPESLLALLQKSPGQNRVTPGGPGGYAMAGPNTVTPGGLGGYSATITPPGQGPRGQPPEYGPLRNPQFGTTPGTPGAQPGFNPYDPYDPNWVRQAPGLPSPGGYYGDANRARNLFQRQQQGDWGQGGNPYLNIGNQPISADYQRQLSDLTGTVVMPGGQQLQSLPSQQWNRQFGLNQDTVYGGQGLDLLRLASQLRGPENAYQNANMLAQARGMPAYNYAQGLLGQGGRSGGFGAWGQTQAPTMGGLLGQGRQSYPSSANVQPTTWNPRQVNNMSPSERKMQDSYLQSAGVNPEDAWDTYNRARPQGNIAMRTRFS